MMFVFKYVEQRLATTEKTNHKTHGHSFFNNKPSIALYIHATYHMKI